MTKAPKAAPGHRAASGETFHLESFLPYSITVLAGQMSEQFAAQYQKQFSVTVAEWRVLAHVAHDDQLSVREISAAVVLDKAKTSRAIARLEAAGYVRFADGQGSASV
jgi:DNA-binding MarR family transcriptional regulator